MTSASKEEEPGSRDEEAASRDGVLTDSTVVRTREEAVCDEERGLGADDCEASPLVDCPHD
jgi:hypothetical protein